MDSYIAHMAMPSSVEITVRPLALRKTVSDYSSHVHLGRLMKEFGKQRMPQYRVQAPHRGLGIVKAEQILLESLSGNS
jgi:hypothetical protein